MNLCRLCSLACLTAFAWSGEPPEVSLPTATPKKPAEWVQQLGHDEYQRRIEAYQALLAIGKKAYFAIKRVEDSEDLEVRRAARKLLMEIGTALIDDLALTLLSGIKSADGHLDTIQFGSQKN